MTPSSRHSATWAIIALCVCAGLAVVAAESQDYVQSENQRCTGHIQQKNAQTLSTCRKLCSTFESCVTFSLNTEEGTCFLYPSGVTCQTSAGWTTGHRDTRCGKAEENTSLSLQCPVGTVISEVVFASYGTPTGNCGSFATGSCHQDSTKEIIEDLCLGETSCTVAASSSVFDEPCSGIVKNLRAQVVCGAGPNFNEDIYFNAWSSQGWAGAETQVEEKKAELTSFLANVPAYPASAFSERGIIVVAGGRYLEPAVVMIKMLRQSGCQLRIQVWHLGADEMSPAHMELLAPLDVETRDFEDFVAKEALAPIAANVGMRLFQLKPLAILHSDLKEVLLLDSDNCPIRDPAYLFESAEFKSTGTVFWPDYWKTSLENPIWKIIGKTPTNTWEQESGQILINKEAAWTALNLCVHMNSEFYMRLLNGDKDTFRFSWLAADVPFVNVATPPTAVGTLKELHAPNQKGFCGHTMLQYDMEGKALFVHHNQLKSSMLPIGQNFHVMRTPPKAEVFRATPIDGLHLPTGQVLPCIDIQGAWLPAVDNKAFPVMDSELADFERRFFEAKATVPQSFFPESKQLSAGMAKVEIRRSAAHPKLMLRQSLRKDGNATCGKDQFELVAAQANTPRECEQVAVCSSEDQVELAPATATSDRICARTAASLKGLSQPRRFTVRRKESKSSAHPFHGQGAEASLEVSVDGIFTEAPELVLTRLQTYEFAVENAPQFMLTTSAEGGSTAKAFVAGVTAVGSNVISFTPATSAPDMLYYQSSSELMTGWRIRLQDSSFALSMAGHHSSHAGPFTRFSTAYAPGAHLFSVSASGDANEFAGLRQSCQDQCASLVGCKGVFAHRTATATTCVGLSDVSGSPVPTAGDNESWLKTVV